MNGKKHYFNFQDIVDDCKKLITDVTVQPIERPVEKQEEYYSGAKKNIV